MVEKPKITILTDDSVAIATVVKPSIWIARCVVVLVGIALPFVVGVGGLESILLIIAFNAVCWGSIVFCSFFYGHAASVIFPAILGFGFLAWNYASLDLGDAQAAITLVLMPVFSLPFVFVGWIIGLIVEFVMRRSSVRQPVK